MDLKGKKALVTGGAVRIGRAICEMLADAGADVCIHYNRSYAAASALRDQLEERGVNAHLAEANLMTETACIELMDKAVAMLGPLDILVNNASVFNKQMLDEADMDVWMGEMWPNFFAPVQLIRAFAERSETGKIVNLLDRRVTSRDTTCVPYLISKKALAEVTQLAALHYAPRITVNGVAPGAVLPPPGKDEQYIKDHAGPVPLGVRVTPEDIAAAVRFVLENDTLTGQILFVDGGQHLENG
jgi:pteridine reductase